MIELIKLLETASRSVRAQFSSWFKYVPAAANWTLVSDYCLDDKNKKSDAFSFVIVLKHDTDANIASYISAAAPRDLKSTRSISEGLLDYLSCPVTFSQSFIVERNSSYLRDAITIELMASIALQLKEVVVEWRDAEHPNKKYYNDTCNKLDSLIKEIKSKKPSTALLRKIFLVAIFATVVMSMINDHKQALSIRWISDRDAMFDRHDGVAFDLSWIFFQIMRRTRSEVSVIDLRRPQIMFATPMMDGVNEHNEFIRLPDYLAGTLADQRLPQIMFTHKKFPKIFNRIFVDSKNNSVIELIKPQGIITARRISFGEPPEGAGSIRYNKNT